MRKPNSEGISTYGTVPPKDKGLGPGSAGQSGDTQGLSEEAEADSESVTELLEEGQASEAEAVEGVETYEGPVAEVRTRQFPEDDVPDEYLNQD